MARASARQRDNESGARLSTRVTQCGGIAMPSDMSDMEQQAFVAGFRNPTRWARGWSGFVVGSAS
jgi:hypothetical protein